MRTDVIAGTMGYYWSGTPKTVSFYCNFDADELSAVRGAMSTWNAVRSTSGNKMVTFALSSSYASNFVCYGSTYTGVVAYTDASYNSSGVLSYVTITLSNVYSWSTTGTYPAYDIRTIVLHELGHALGISHCHASIRNCSTACTSNIMKPLIGRGVRIWSLAYYDQHWYQVIYS